jgi:hypothetical protein
VLLDKVTNSFSFLVENIFQKTNFSLSHAPFVVLWETPAPYFELQENLTTQGRSFFSLIANKALSSFTLIKEVLFLLSCQKQSPIFTQKHSYVRALTQLRYDFIRLQRSLLSEETSVIFFLPWSKKFKSYGLGQTFITSGLDYFLDWRELKLERELWRSLDVLNMSRQQLNFRKKYYADLFEPTSITNKVSTWLPNHLIPG